MRDRRPRYRFGRYGPHNKDASWSATAKTVMRPTTQLIPNASILAARQVLQAELQFVHLYLLDKRSETKVVLLNRETARTVAVMKLEVEIRRIKYKRSSAAGPCQDET